MNRRILRLEAAIGTQGTSLPVPPPDVQAAFDRSFARVVALIHISGSKAVPAKYATLLEDDTLEAFYADRALIDAWRSENPETTTSEGAEAKNRLAALIERRIMGMGDDAIS